MTPEQFQQANEIIESVRAERTGKESPADRAERRKIANMTDGEFEKFKRDVMR